MTSAQTTTTFADGVRCLVRHWEASSAWARMLIVHGLAEHSGRYEHVGDRFARAGVDTWAFDLRGFGGSGGTRAHVSSWSQYLEDAEDRLTALPAGLPKVLLGHSMGGLVALSYALSRRTAPQLLVLSAPALDADVPAWQRRLAPLLGKITPRVALPNAIEASQLSTDPRVGTEYFADPLVYPKTTARLGAELFAAMEDVRSRLGELSIPTLVIHGGEDTLVPTRFSAPLGDVSGVERVVLDGFRHESFNESDRDAAPSVVLDWLRRQEATRSS